MLLYFFRQGARRFQCISGAHNGNPELLRPCRNRLRLGSTTSFQGDGPDVSRTGEKRFRFPTAFRSVRSQVHETVSDTDHGERASHSHAKGIVQSSPEFTQQEITTHTGPDFTVKSDYFKSQKQSELEQQVLEALHDEDPHRLLEALAQVSKYHGYFHELPTTTLSEIIYMLQPSEFIDREKAIYRELNPKYISALGSGTPRLESLFESYANSIWRLMGFWKTSGKQFGLKEYKALLNVARAVGNGLVANGIWNELSRANVALDTEAVNLYMEARCWSGAYNPGYGQELRVIRLNLEKRSRPADEENPQEAGFEGFTVGVLGIRAQMTRVYDEMVDQGLNPDADTFMHLMVAMGREGDLAGVKSILQRVWAINVEEIVGAQEELPETSITLSATSALYPSERLLYMVAHIFGSNNDASTALRVVDYISYKYNIPINLQTWQELVTWTYVLSSPKSQGPDEKKVDLRTGQLPITALSDLWKIMRSPPYNIQPTMLMYFQRVSNLRKRAFLQPMLSAMQEMRSIHQAQIQRYKACMTNHIQSMNREQMDLPKKPRFSKDQQHAALEQNPNLRLEKLAEYRDFTYMQRAVGYLLSVQRWTSRHGSTFYNVLWQRIGVHHTIAEFSSYMDRFGFRYPIRTGEVHIQLTQVTMTVDRLETREPGVHAVMSTGAYRLTIPKYKRYGSLSSMDWDNVEFEDDEEGLEGGFQTSWRELEMQSGDGYYDDKTSPLGRIEEGSSHSTEIARGESGMQEDFQPKNSTPPP